MIRNYARLATQLLLHPDASICVRSVDISTGTEDQVFSEILLGLRRYGLTAKLHAHEGHPVIELDQQPAPNLDDLSDADLDEVLFGVQPAPDPDAHAEAERYALSPDNAYALLAENEVNSTVPSTAPVIEERNHDH